MHKISYPQMGDYHVPIKYLLSHVLNAEIIEPPKITAKTVEIGSKNSPNTICMPFKYTLGTMIEALDKGADTLIQMGGGCRYGYYAELQEEVLKEKGYKFQMINLVTEGKTNYKRIKKLFKKIDPKFSQIKLIKYTFITLKMVKYMDEIDNYIRENIGFEKVKGSFENLKRKMLKSFSETKGYLDLKRKYNRYKEEFQKLEIEKKGSIKIGIIGELYTIMEPYSNYFLEKQLASHHIEIKRFTNVHYLLIKKSKRMKKYLKQNKRIKYMMGADASDNIANTEYLCKHKYDGIIHIKSSFCTPEIGAMSIINKIASENNIPVLFFSFDEATSEVGIKTRLEAFYDMLEMRKKSAWMLFRGRYRINIYKRSNYR